MGTDAEARRKLKSLVLEAKLIINLPVGDAERHVWRFVFKVSKIEVKDG